MLNRCLTLTGLIVALVIFPSCGGKATRAERYTVGKKLGKIL